MTGDGTRTFSYDSENRLTSVTTPQNYGIAYDPQGRFRALTLTGFVAAFDMVGTDIVAARINAGATTERYAFGPGADEPMVGYDNAGVRYYFHADGHGNTVAHSNAAGSATRTLGYDEYGKPSAFSSRFLHAGKMHLGGVNAYYNNARFYDYNLGRFLQVDPIGYDGGINLYAYVDNDPINATDPDGQDRYNCNVTIRDGGFSGSCSFTADESSKTTVTYNITRIYVDAYGREHSITETRRQVFEGSISQESLASRLFLGVGRQIVATIERNLSRFVGAEVYLGGARSGSAMAGHTVTPPAQSPVWRGLRPYRGDIKTDGERYYTYDRRHGEIEVFDRQGRHLGTRNAITGAREKPPVPGRRLDR